MTGAKRHGREPVEIAKTTHRQPRAQRRLRDQPLHEIQLQLFAGQLSSSPSRTQNFAASLVSPVPLYFADCGYGHSGRVIFLPWTGSSASWLGRLHFWCDNCARRCAFFHPLFQRLIDTCCASPAGANCPNEFGPGPPAQCCTPGAM